MVGKGTGLQARIKELVPGAELLSYAAHFLNLLGVHAIVDNCN